MRIVRLRRVAGMLAACIAIISIAASLEAGEQASSKVTSKTITYHVGDLTCKGYLAWDASIEEARPGVLVIHEWWGLNDYARQRADQLAELGYVAFACDMYGEGKNTTHPKEAMEMSGKVRENIDAWRDRAIAGLAVLKSQEQCKGQNLGVIGYCFGGATALQLAYSGADVDVVTFHAALPVPSADEARKIKGWLLINHGDADPMVSMDTLGKLTNVLNEADVHFKVNVYPSAKHSFTNKGADKVGIDGLEYNAEADEKSWQAMKELFKEELHE